MLDTLSWTVADAGIHLAKSHHEWKVSFICDLEYKGFGLHDLAPMLCHPEPMWSLKEPLSGDSKSALADA